MRRRRRKGERDENEEGVSYETFYREKRVGGGGDSKPANMVGPNDVSTPNEFGLPVL